MAAAAFVFHSLYDIQILDGAQYRQYAAQQQLLDSTIQSTRGEIYDASGITLASTSVVWTIWADPSYSTARFTSQTAEATGEGLKTADETTLAEVSRQITLRLLSGDGESTADITYTQQRVGDVRLRLVLTDEKGLPAERVLQTSYVREPLRVSFTQDKFELAALDRARVDFTVEQDDYDGTYTVQVEGTPTLFRNLTDDIGPVTGYTVAGNGTYPLRIRPEAVGENPYRITVTDENGNSAFFDSFVTGIKTVSCFTCSFSKISGGIEVVAEGTYPVMNALTNHINPKVTGVLRGGATKTI